MSHALNSGKDRFTKMVYHTNQNVGIPRDRSSRSMLGHAAPVAPTGTAPYSAPCACRIDAEAPRASYADGAQSTEGAMPALAMIYSPNQVWQDIYSEEDALTRGTIFAELDKPFCGSACGGGACHG